MLAPICLFAYNRLEETTLTVDALKRNNLASKSELYIFSDGAKDPKGQSKVLKVRKYLNSITGFKSITIVESENNKGLANSIINGVAEVLKKHEKVIVLEDDLITSPNFLDFMNQSLDFYKLEERVQSISAYSFSLNEKYRDMDVYFHMRPFSWGWGTWKNRWNENIFNKELIEKEILNNKSILKIFNKKCGEDISQMLLDSLNNKNDSWYVRWVYDHFKNEHYSIYPFYSLVENIGHGQESTHCKGINSYAFEIDDGLKVDFILKPFSVPNSELNRAFLKYFTNKHKIYYRLSLLKSKGGRSLVISDLKMRIGKFF